MSNFNQEQLRAWFAKNKTAVPVGCGVAALLIVAGGANEGGSGAQQPPPQQPCAPGQPGCAPQPNGGGTGPVSGNPGGDGGPGYGDGGGGGTGYDRGSGGVGGGTDMDDWQRRQRADDEAQRERVRTIREEEKCRDGDTVSIHTGC